MWRVRSTQVATREPPARGRERCEVETDVRSRQRDRGSELFVRGGGSRWKVQR